MLITPEAIQTFKEYQSLEKEIRQLWAEYKQFLSSHVNSGNIYYRWSRSQFLLISELDQHGIELIIQNYDNDTEHISFGWNDINATTTEREAMWRERYKDTPEFAHWLKNK